MNQILPHKFHQFCRRGRLHFPHGGGNADLKGRGSVERQCHNRSVPFLEGILLRKFPEKRTIISVVLVLTGIGFLTLGKSGGLLRPGSLYLLMAALFYAAAIITTGYFSKKYDPLLLGIVQVGTMGVWTHWFSMSR